MPAVIKCNWAEGSPAEVFTDLAAYDPMIQLIRERATDSPGAGYHILDSQEGEDPPSAFLAYVEDSGVITLQTPNLPHDFGPNLYPTLCSILCEPDKPRLSCEQDLTLQSLIQTYTDIFSDGASDIGCVKGSVHVSHKIKVQQGTTPAVTNRPLSSFSIREREFIQAEVHRLLELGIVGR